MAGNGSLSSVSSSHLENLSPSALSASLNLNLNPSTVAALSSITNNTTALIQAMAGHQDTQLIFQHAQLSGGNGQAGGCGAPPQFSADYLSQLLKDKKNLSSFSNMFLHVERLMDDEITKVRAALFHLENCNKEALILPEPVGNVVTLQEKVYVPVKEHPEYNFVGRILGPRGMTAKQLEQETNCKIMVRGKGSMRDKKKEDMNRGKPNWEHLTDELHVLIQCEDTENRAVIKLQRAVEEVKRLLIPAPEGEDDLKRKQLMELAIINGTYRPSSQNKIALQTPRLLTPMSLTSSLRSPSLGAPLILSPNRVNGAGGAASNAIATSLAGALPNGFSALSNFLPSTGLDFNAAAAAAGLLYNFPLDPLVSLSAGYPYTAPALSSPLFAGDYPGLDAQAGAILNQRRILAHVREHPYQRPNTSSTM